MLVPMPMWGGGSTGAGGRIAGRARIERMSRVRWDWLGSTWLWGGLIALVSWPVGSLLPQPGLDNSFAAGLHLAARDNLQFGQDLVATYGPLGYLRYPF